MYKVIPKKRLYLISRDLHLYFGLFISPVVAIFSLSVFFLVHAWVPRASGSPAVATVTGLAVPEALDRFDTRERVNALQPVMRQLGVAGEIGFIQHFPKEHRLLIPVMAPGRETFVDLDYLSKAARVSTRNTGMAETLIYLHKSPGPHLVAIRGNWLPTLVWRWFADISVYLLLFVSISGVYLWMAVRAERRAGLILISAGAISFFGIVYGLSH